MTSVKSGILYSEVASAKNELPFQKQLLSGLLALDLTFPIKTSHFIFWHWLIDWLIDLECVFVCVYVCLSAHVLSRGWMSEDSSEYVPTHLAPY